MAINPHQNDAVVQGPSFNDAYGDYIGSAQHWADLQAQIEGRRQRWVQHGGEVALQWGPEGEVKPWHPTIPKLAKYLSAAHDKGVQVPEGMLGYIRDRLNKTIKVPRGNPHKVKSSYAAHAQRMLAWRVNEVRELCENDPTYRTEHDREDPHGKPKGGSLERAIEQVYHEQRAIGEGHEKVSLRRYYMAWQVAKMPTEP